MNLEQARAKLLRVSSGTAQRHTKILIADLCMVVKFLLDELDRIKPPTASVPTKQFPANGESNPHKPIHSLPPTIKPNPMIPCQPPDHNKPSVDISGDTPSIKSSPFNLPHPHKKGNAGDAE